MIQWVWERACRSGAEQVAVATEDVRIADAARDFGARVCMTSADHLSGTDRVGEAVTQLRLADESIVVNVQGDEPLLPPVLIDQVATILHGLPDADAATLCEPLERERTDADVVKVVRDVRGRALYFSRADVPWASLETGDRPMPRHRHVGLYAWRVGRLLHYTSLPPCPLERAERLEQLRLLYYGGWLQVEEAAVSAGIGVDTPQELERAQRMLEADVGP